MEKIVTNTITFHVSHTTTERTMLNHRNVHAGCCVNVERAMKMSDRLGGHIVTGHVDEVGKIIDIKKTGNDFDIEILISKSISQYIVPKGSITVNGVSLTVSKRNSSSFFVTVIPHTYKNTNLETGKTGDPVNLEVDILSRYIIDSKKYNQGGAYE